MKIPTPKFIKNNELNEHEKELLRCALAGESCHLFDKAKAIARDRELQQAEANKPEAERRGFATLWNLAVREQAAADAAPAIRADLIRFLARGGNEEHSVDPYGARLAGARITGTLTLEGCRDLRTLCLNACQFEKAPVLRDAAGQVIDFSGSHLPGLGADRLTTTGTVILRDGFEAAGAVRFLGAQIGGDLVCMGGKFSGEPSALSLQRGCVTGVFVWKTAEGDRPTGTVDLWSAEVGDLCDDLESWPEGKVILDGFRYGRFSDAPTSYAMRKDWLERQRHEHLTNDFKPQPFELLAQVLREMGHTEDAKRVAMLKQRLHRRANWLQANKQWREATHKLRASWNLVTTVILGFFSLLFQGVVGFGYRPFRALYWLAGFWLAGIVMFSWADREGAMVPNNPFVLRADDWMYCLWQEEAGQVTASQCWLEMAQQDEKSLGHARGEDFPRLNPTVYALDTFVPFVNLHQEPHWIPDAERGDPALLGKPTGWWARLYLWIHILFGWIITALFAASLTDLVKKDF